MSCIICQHDQFKNLIIRNPLNKSEIYTYKVCLNCGLGELELAAHDMSKHYDAEYDEYEKEATGIITAVAKMFFLDRYEYVKRFSNLNTIKKVLDIGSGKGKYLSNFLNDSNISLVGIDVNESAIELSKEKYPNIKFVYSNDLTDIEQFGKYDLVSMWHVLEHIDNPVEYLKQVNRLLTNKGDFYVEVPNINSMNLKIFGSRYQWISLPEHLYFYSEKSLKMLLEKTGFEIRNVYYPKMFPLLFTHHIENKLLKLLSIPISGLLFLLSGILKSSEAIRVYSIKNI